MLLSKTLCVGMDLLSRTRPNFHVCAMCHAFMHYCKYCKLESSGFCFGSVLREPRKPASMVCWSPPLMVSPSDPKQTCTHIAAFRDALQILLVSPPLMISNQQGEAGPNKGAEASTHASFFFFPSDAYFKT